MSQSTYFDKAKWRRPDSGRALSPLGRELLIVIVIKLILLIALKLAFFSDPPEIPPGYGLDRYLPDQHPTTVPSATGEDKQ